ncbi:MAG TPA: NAD(P)/FAD-dependent oxidoreductase [Steroidobacteraceae bacterium]|nr:NAD(P)/FAD-dependent oxidoreductase [Steroidobacteraceae bacterium]
MRTDRIAQPATDAVVVGASFAGLASALALARAGFRVTVLEKKTDPGAKLHTTGIIVKDAVDQIALLDTLPAPLVRRISGVRLYAPNLRYVDLEAPGYYFLATDTPAVMRWLAGEAERAGAAIAYSTAFTRARRLQSGFDVDDFGTTRFLIGADGPRSRVAGALGLGTSTRFLAGVEYEYAGATFAAPDKLHCFIDRRLARGYIGWVFAGVGGVQAGLARRHEGPGALKPDEAMDAFLAKIAPVIDLRGITPTGIRAGLIPCGGVVSPVAVSRALLVGDAAGMCSPVTAGGIHTALKHGLAAGNAVADFLHGRAEDPSGWFVRSYPRFRLKRLLRFCYDHFQSDLAFNWMLATWPMRSAASIVYFHHKGVFDRRFIGRTSRRTADRTSSTRT